MLADGGQHEHFVGLEAVGGVPQGPPRGPHGCEHDLWVGPQFLRGELQRDACEVDGPQGHLAVGLQLRRSKLQCKGVVIDGCENNLSIGPQVLRRVSELMAVVSYGHQYQFSVRTGHLVQLLQRQLALAQGLPELCPGRRHAQQSDVDGRARDRFEAESLLQASGVPTVQGLVRRSHAQAVRSQDQALLHHRDATTSLNKLLDVAQGSVQACAHCCHRLRCQRTDNPQHDLPTARAVATGKGLIIL
mmetsp:Transcript_32418/g.102987  ORF Transcript_32418/g.102987 Transcript_32418/m.102987 type:complete len:246 (+) Transcript_32418:250-987(+)